MVYQLCQETYIQHEYKLSSSHTHSLDPDGDPLCSLLMIDYYALRAGEYKFLMNVFREWEVRITSVCELASLSDVLPLSFSLASQKPFSVAQLCLLCPPRLVSLN